MSTANRLIVSILVIAAAATAFWILALSPKREEADKLGGEVEQLQVALAQSQAKATEAAAARREFPADYSHLVVLGQAVPASDDTSSLLVELNRIANRSRVKFESLQLGEGGEVTEVPLPSAAPPTTPEASASPSGAVPAAATIPPTEAAAALLPLGASVGPAGLATMPYDLAFSGSFFHIADFIHGIDSLVGTSDSKVSVDGRLVTLNGFALNADPTAGIEHLEAAFSVTTYLTPPSQGVTAGATPTEPAPAIATPAATAPSSPEGEAVQASSSETPTAR
jgi:Tfp pilus assembly protein PilO